MPNRVMLEDTPIQVLTKLSQGNPGALTVLMRWVKEGPVIDPDSMHPILAMCSLDDMDIVGPKIWVLYKDVAGQDLRVFLALLRARQLGFLAESDLKAAAEERDGTLPTPLPELVAQVEARLPNFLRAADPRRDERIQAREAGGGEW